MILHAATVARIILGLYCCRCFYACGQWARGIMFSGYLPVCLSICNKFCECDILGTKHHIWTFYFQDDQEWCVHELKRFGFSSFEGLNWFMTKYRQKYTTGRVSLVGMHTLHKSFDVRSICQTVSTYSENFHAQCHVSMSGNDQIWTKIQFWFHNSI